MCCLFVTCHLIGGEVTEALLQRSGYHHTGAHYHRDAHHNTWWVFPLSCVCVNTLLTCLPTRWWECD